MAKSKPVTSKADGAAWAASQRFIKRGCETCRWGRRCPAGLRFINDALAQKRAGKASFSLDTLCAEIVRAYEYPLTVGALLNHYRRECQA